MPASTPARSKRPQFTIGGVMISIAAVALVLSLLKPAARIYRDSSPEISRLIDRMASVDTGIVLSCVIIGLYVILRLMGEDEKN